MKIRLLMIALLAGFSVTSSNAANIDEFAGPNTYVNVFELDSTTYLWGAGDWQIADMQAITTDNRTFELLPNISQYGDGTDVYWVDIAAEVGNKWLNANTYFELNPISAEETTVRYSFDVTAFDLDPSYTLKGFIKILNPGNGWSTDDIWEITITETGSHTYDFSLGNHNGLVLQAGFSMDGRNANPATDWGSATVTVTELITFNENDEDPPTPDPMIFEIPPYATGDSSISMTATNATDDSSVEYYFTCTAGGGNDSGWQSSTTYVDSGLSSGTEYTYTVKARDIPGLLETVASAPASATTTGADNEKPTPDPMTFEDTEASSVSIKLTATEATDESAVEYFFDCTSGGGNDSGWQSSPIYVDTGLAPGSNYTYTVTARDTSGAQNTTDASDPVLVTTMALPESSSLINSLQGFTGDNTQGTTYHDLALAGLEFASDTAEKIVSFDGSGATFGDAATWQSRNTLRTLGQDYGDVSFEVYATFITQNTTEQAGFIGVGQGIIGNWGVPDFELVGVNAINAEVQGNFCKMFTHTNGVIAVIDETVGITTFTNRVRMVHDAVAETIIVELDTDYAGGAFVADRILGTHSTVGVWADMPQRIYVAAGAGVLLKDFVINSSFLAEIGEVSISVLDVGGGELLSEPAVSGAVVLSWTGSAGQTYDVQYKTSLNDPSWTLDPSPGCSDILATASGTMSATSTVNTAEAFYQIISE